MTKKFSRKVWQPCAGVEDDLLCYDDVGGYGDYYEGEVYDSDAEEAAPPEPEAQKVCPICCEPTDNGDLVQLMKGCRHEPACRTCLRRIYVLQAQEGAENYPLRCYHPGCTLTVRDTQLINHKLVHTDEELSRHYRLMELAKVLRGAQVYYCANCNHPHTFCSEIYRTRSFHCKQCYEPVSVSAKRPDEMAEYYEFAESIGRNVARLYNGRTQCSSCHAIFRPKGPSGGEDQIVDCPGCHFNFFVASSDVLRVVDALHLVDVIESGLGECPGCHTVVFKHQGCDHMTCVCGEEFSWKSSRLLPPKLRRVLHELME